MAGNGENVVNIADEGVIALPDSTTNSNNNSSNEEIINSEESQLSVNENQNENNEEKVKEEELKNEKVKGKEKRKGKGKDRSQKEEGEEREEEQENTNDEVGIYEKTRFYVTLSYNYALANYLNWWTGIEWFTYIDDHVILGALPTTAVVERISKKENVKTIINLCREYGGDLKYYESLEITEFRFRTKDFTTPTLEHIQEAVKVISERQEKDKKVYIHCKAGKGRSATIALCWLVFNQKLTPDEAQQKLSQLRPQIDTDISTRPEVLGYYQALKESQQQQQQQETEKKE